MLNWVDLLLRMVYYYSHLVGVGNFEFDWRTGRVFSTTWSNLYAITVNVFIVILFGFQLAGNKTLTVVFSNANNLNEYVIIFVTLLRIAAGLVTLLNRWRHQSQLIILTRTALRLILTRPQVIRMSRPRLLVKFLNGAVSDLFQFAIAFDVVRRAGASSFLEMGLQLWMSAILNLAIAQHFLMMLFVRAHYQLLNTELRQVIEESKDLSYRPPRKGAFMTRCCSLADQLEDIARQQSQLQSIVIQLDEVIGVQVLMAYAGYYASAVGSAYTAYGMIKYDLMSHGISLKDIIMSFTWCFFYYMDAILNVAMGLHVQDDHKEMIRLLGQRTLFASGLDARLEESFESFQLQLLRNPLKVDCLKLFPVNRDSSWAMIGSIILHTILLIQYDMENF